MQVCQPYGGPLLRWHPVTPAVGKPSYDAPDCCADVRAKKGAITNFFKSKGPSTGTGWAGRAPGGAAGSNQPDAAAIRNPDDAVDSVADAAMPPEVGAAEVPAQKRRRV